MNMIWIQDLIKGTHISKTKRFLCMTDSWSETALADYQLTKLKRLVGYAYSHVPYYKTLFDSIGLQPQQIKSLSDMAKIPILTKEIARKEFSNLVPDDLDVNSRKCLKSKTGGTTGVPMPFYKNTQTRDFTWGGYYRWYTWMGIKPGMREAVLWGDSSVLNNNVLVRLKKRTLDALSCRLSISSFSINDENLPLIAEKLIKFQPVILRGYLSSVLQVARFFNENHLTLPSLKSISTTTETLLPIYREFIERTFKVKVYDQYGCGECNSIAFECPAHQGLHINEEHCIVEVLDDSNKQCVEKIGRIIVTDLDNYATPFIRYENGDSAVMSSLGCSCGRSSHLLKEISGRTADVVYLKDGSGVHGVFFTDILYEMGFSDFKYFTRFQIIQKRKGDFVCHLEKTSTPMPADELWRIRSVFSKYGNNVSVDLVDTLNSDKSGKFRYVISEL